MMSLPPGNLAIESSTTKIVGTTDPTEFPASPPGSFVDGSTTNDDVGNAPDVGSSNDPPGNILRMSVTTRNYLVSAMDDKNTDEDIFTGTVLPKSANLRASLFSPEKFEESMG